MLPKRGKKRLGADSKITDSLRKKQPQTTEEICKKVGITIKYFKYDLAKFLIKEEKIKQLPDERWALWDYEPLVSKKKYSASEIVHLIEILEDENRSQDFRISAGIKLLNCCSGEGEIEGGKNELRSFFIETLDNFESNEGLEFTHIYNALGKYVAFQLQGEEDILWMRKICYPKLLSLFNEISSIEGRDRILRILSEIYRTDELDMEQKELTKILRKKFFDPNEDGSIAMNCWEKFWQANEELREAYKHEIHGMAKSWDTFWSRADDELKEMLEDVNSNMTESDKETLKKRAEEVMRKYYNF